MDQMLRFTCPTCHLGFTRDGFLAHIFIEHDLPIIRTTLDKVEGDRVQLRYQKQHPLQQSSIQTLPRNAWINGLIICDDQVFLVELEELSMNMSVWISVVGFSAVDTSPYFASLCYVQKNWKFPKNMAAVKSWRGIVEPMTAFNDETPKFIVRSHDIWRTFKYDDNKDFCWNLCFKIHKSPETRDKIINWGGGLQWNCLNDLNIWDSLFPFLSPEIAEDILNLMDMQDIFQSVSSPTCKGLHKSNDIGRHSNKSPAHLGPINSHSDVRLTTAEHAAEAALQRASAAFHEAKNSDAFRITPPPTPLDTNIPAQRSSTHLKQDTFTDDVQNISKATSDLPKNVSITSKDSTLSETPDSSLTSINHGVTPTEETIPLLSPLLKLSSNISGPSTSGNENGVDSGQGLAGKYGVLMEKLYVGDTLSEFDIELIEKGFMLLVTILDCVVRQIKNQQN